LLKLKDCLAKGRILPFATSQFSSAATDGETIVNEIGLLQSLGQVSSSQTGEVFRDFLRGHVREMICEVMAAEVTELCGPKHLPSSSDHYRAGSANERVLVEGEREDVTRPRVRRKASGGWIREVELSSYQAAQYPQKLQEQIVQAVVSGVSSRAVEETSRTLRASSGPVFRGFGKTPVASSSSNCAARISVRSLGVH
jgi:putative transposase